jgi:cytochrome c
MSTSHTLTAMRRLTWAMFALFTAAATTSWSLEARADASQLQTLMQRNNCTACHLIDKRKYGPNFNEVAVRYASDGAAVSKLTAKIRAGGSGVWGEDMMPPQAHVSESDARAIAEQVMALKP